MTLTTASWEEGCTAVQRERDTSRRHAASCKEVREDSELAEQLAAAGEAAGITLPPPGVELGQAQPRLGESHDTEGWACASQGHNLSG